MGCEAAVAISESDRIVACAPQYFKFCTSGNTVMLLSQIVYWFSNNRLRVRRSGKLWLAKKREDLAAECGLTFNQYRWCISKLKNLGLVVVEQHKFAGDAISHIWLDEQRLQELCDSPVDARVTSRLPPEWQAGCHPYTENTNRDYDIQKHERAAHAVGKESRSYGKAVRKQLQTFVEQEPRGGTTEKRNEVRAKLVLVVNNVDIERKTEKVMYERPNAAGRKEQQERGQGSPLINLREAFDDGRPQTDHLRSIPRHIPDWVAERPGYGESKMGRFTLKEWMMKASEILARHREQQSGKTAKLSATSLAMQWKRLYSQEYNEFVKDLTHKEIGQLKTLVQKIGEKSVPVLSFVFESWGKFGFEAKCRKGLKFWPDRPTVGIVLQHYDVALQLIAEKPEPQVVKVVAPKPAPKETPKPEEPVQYATIEDVMNTLQEWEDHE